MYARLCVCCMYVSRGSCFWFKLLANPLSSFVTTERVVVVLFRTSTTPKSRCGHDRITSQASRYGPINVATS